MRKKIFLIIILLFYLFLFISFQTVDSSQFSHIDKHSRNVPSSYTNNLDILTNYLISIAKNDMEKVRAIWIWITDNISYDVFGYFTGSITTYEWDEVFKKRKGVCSGYSSLFKKMCDIAGIRCEVISGFAKGYGFDVAATSISGSNHAWNAVYVDNKWYLIDSTWGAGYVDKNRNFVKNYEEFYFCTKPEYFIWSHFPENPDWQLLNKKIDTYTFLSYPKVWPIFFKLELNPISHSTGKIITSKNEFNIAFKTPKDNIQILAVLQDALTGKEIARPTTFVLKEGNEYIWRVYINLSQKGKFYLQLFAGYNNQTFFTSAATYYIIYN